MVVYAEYIYRESFSLNLNIFFIIFFAMFSSSLINEANLLSGLCLKDLKFWFNEIFMKMGIWIWVW